MDADTTSPTVVISSDAVAPVTGPFSIAIAFSEPVTGFELADLVVGNSSPSAIQGNSLSYSATITPAASEAVTVDIAAGAAEDNAGNPGVAVDQLSIVADLANLADGWCWCLPRRFPFALAACGAKRVSPPASVGLGVRRCELRAAA